MMGSGPMMMPGCPQAAPEEGAPQGPSKVSGSLWTGAAGGMPCGCMMPMMPGEETRRTITQSQIYVDYRLRLYIMYVCAFLCVLYDVYVYISNCVYCICISLSLGDPGLSAGCCGCMGMPMMPGMPGPCGPPGPPGPPESDEGRVESSG